MLLTLTLVIAGLILLILEIFLPGGILGALAYLCFLSGTIMAYGISANFGHSILLFSISSVLFSLYYTFIYFQKTKIGKKLTLNTATERLDIYDEKLELKGLIGRTVTDIRPGGMVLVGGKRYDALSSGEPISAGKKVVVFEVEGNNIYIREQEK